MLLGTLSIVISVGVVLVMATLLLASGANGSPEWIGTLKRSLISLAVVTLIGVAASVWGMIAGKTGVSVVAGLAPTVWSIVLFVILARADSAS